MTHAFDLWASESALARLSEPQRYPALFAVREALLGWRFYHQFRTDEGSPLRQAQVPVSTPVLAHDGRDLAAALRTIQEIGDEKALASAVDRVMPGARLDVVDGTLVRIVTPGLPGPSMHASCLTGHSATSASPPRCCRPGHRLSSPSPRTTATREMAPTPPAHLPGRALGYVSNDSFHSAPVTHKYSSAGLPAETNFSSRTCAVTCQPRARQPPLEGAGGRVGTSPMSTRDQVRRCRAFAEARALAVAGVLKDAAKSGAHLERADLQRLLTEARSPRCRFQTVLVDDLSRLSRDLGNTWQIVFRDLATALVRVIDVSTGMASDSAGARIQLGALALVNDMMLRARLHHQDALFERVAIGHFTGPRVFAQHAGRSSAGTAHCFT